MARRQERPITKTRAVPAAAPDLPVWVPPVAYAAVTVLLFREFFLGGVSMLGTDSLVLSYFARNFYTEFVQAAHRLPYWNPLLFGGLPFVEGMHGDIFYPPSLAMFAIDARSMWGWKMALHVFLAGVFTYLWLRKGLGLGRIPAFFGGLVYMMGTDLVSLVLPGGDGKLFVSALAPLVFWLAERAAARQTAADFAAFALGIALILFTSHMQAAYFCVWGVSLYFLFRVWQGWRADHDSRRAARLVGLYALAGILAVGAAAVQFLPPFQYLREHSHRVDRLEPAEGGYAWATSYSLNAEEIVALAVPEFVGEVAQTSATRAPAGYWGRNPLKLNNEYAGLVPLLLIPVLFIGRRTAQAWFFALLGILALLYALGANTPVFRLFYLVPGVSLFRAPSIIIFLYGLSVATLGALAAQRLQGWLATARPDTGAAVLRRVLWAGAGAFAVLALLASAGVITSVWLSLFGDAVRPDRLAANEPFIRRGFWLAFALAAAVAGTWEVAVRGLINARTALLALAFWAAADLYRASRPFVVNTALLNEHADAGTLFRPDDSIMALQRLRDAGGVFRVMDLGPLLGAPPTYGQNDLAMHGLEQLAGHHGNELGRYRNLIGGEHALNLATSELRLADITNTEYFLIPGRIEDPRLEEVHNGVQSVVYRNRAALPRAYLAGAVEVLDGEAAIERLLSADFDARNSVILPEALPADVEVRQGVAGAVEWVEREVDRLTLRVAPDRPALLVVLDNWFPAWEATVNGHIVPIYRANHTFRAVAVPPGEHTVVFRYTPADLSTGATVSLLTLGLLLAVVLAGAAARYRRGDAAAS
ncbi:MAG TPA: YfhO family protein [Longimicrobiales bacterium]|nr:YfhO family protein [Longimicrobiales bacterium]